MKRKQLAAILLSAIMAASACVPVNGISAVAAENAGAESTEESLTVEVPAEAVESVTEAEAPDAQEGTETPDMQGGSAEAAIAPAEENAAEEASAKEAPAEEEAVPDAGTPAEETPAEEPAEETAAEAAAAADDTVDEAATAEDHSAQVIEEEAREEVSLPALRALQPEDFKKAKEISAGDKKNEKVFRNNGYAVWKFTPDESGSYRFSAKSNCSIYVVLYDADYNEIAYDERPDPCIERYFHKGTTYYLASCPYHPEEIPILSASIRLDRQDMPDFYVEGYSESQIRVPYGKEAVLSVYARSSTGNIYYKWKDGSGKIVGTSDSYAFTAKSNTEIYCTVSDGPDEKTAHSEERRFAVSIENHLTVDADGEYESSYGDWIKSVGFGDPVTLKVTASADDDSELTYRWEREELSMYEDEDGELVSWYKYVTIEGEETDTYEIESADESGMYCCTVTDRFGNMASLYFDLRVATLVSAYPEGAEEGDDTVSISTDYDSALTLRAIVNAADASKVKFVWYRVEEDVDGSVNDWKRIPGADTAEYEIESVEKTERYHCNVSDGVREFDLNFYVSVENALSVKAEGAEESRSNVAYLYPEPGSSVTLRVIQLCDPQGHCFRDG